MHYLLSKTSVREAMNAQPITVTADMKLTEAAKVIRDHKLYGLCVVDEKGDLIGILTIKDLIETRVRPAVANDGGDITFRGFKDGVVYLNMKGACAGCPSSTATLQHGIQNLLKHFVPDVVEVRPI